MCRRYILLWIIVGIIAILVITLFSIVGAIYGYKEAASTFDMPDRTKPSWKSIGPPNTQITGLKVLSIKEFYPPCYVVILITSQGQLLSSGVNPDYVQEWPWIDISNGITWSDFPLAALGQAQENNCLLWIKHEGKEYRVDTNGEWLLVESSDDSPFLNPLENLVEVNPDYSATIGWVTPPGEIDQMQVVNIRQIEDTGTEVFALLKEKEGLWFMHMYRSAYEVIGTVFYGIYVFGVVLFGCGVGFILAVFVISLSVISLIIYLRKKRPAKA